MYTGRKLSNGDQKDLLAFYEHPNWHLGRKCARTLLGAFYCRLGVFQTFLHALTINFIQLSP